MTPDNHRQSKEWKQARRKLISEQANRCEECGVKNFTVGIRDGDSFTPISGNPHLDGMHYTRSHGDALSVMAPYNLLRPAGSRRAMMVILQMAHLDNDLQNHDPANLKALCQHCFNKQFKEYRQTRRKGGMPRRKEEWE